MFGDIWQFIAAISGQWVALMSAIVSLGVAVWLRLKHKPDISDAPFRIIGAVCVLLACFLAWRGEHTARVKAESQKPNLVGVIDQKVAGFSPELNSTQVFLIVSVINLGTPSIAQGWHLTVECRGHTLGPFVPWFIPEGLRVNRDSGASVIFRRADALYDKVMVPIPQGGLVRGWIRFVVPGSESDNLRRASRWRLRFEDVTGREVIAEDRATDEGPPLYSPGASQPLAEKPSPTGLPLPKREP